MADVEFTTLEKAYPSSSDQQVAVYSASGGAPQRVRLNASPYPANKFPLEVRWPTGNVCFAADEIGAYYRVEPKTLFNPLGTETTSSAGYRSNDYGWYFDGVSFSGVGVMQVGGKDAPCQLKTGASAAANQSFELLINAPTFQLQPRESIVDAELHYTGTISGTLFADSYAKLNVYLGTQVTIDQDGNNNAQVKYYNAANSLVTTTLSQKLVTGGAINAYINVFIDDPANPTTYSLYIELNNVEVLNVTGLNIDTELGNFSNVQSSSSFVLIQADGQPPLTFTPSLISSSIQVPT